MNRTNFYIALVVVVGLLVSSLVFLLQPEGVAGDLSMLLLVTTIAAVALKRVEEGEKKVEEVRIIVNGQRTEMIQHVAALQRELALVRKQLALEEEKNLGRDES